MAGGDRKKHPRLLEESEHPPAGLFVVQAGSENHQRHSIEEFMGYAGSVQSLLELVFLLSNNEFVEWGGISFQKQLQ